METLLSKDFIDKRQYFLEREYNKVKDRVSRLNNELENAEKELEDVIAELNDIKSLKPTH